MRCNAGAVDRALETWSSLAGHPAVDGLGAVRLAHNLALCHVDLGMPERAIEPLHGCIAEFECQGMSTDSAAPADDARVHGARAGDRFRLPALEVAEALLILDRADEVPAVCRGECAGVPQRQLAAAALRMPFSAPPKATPASPAPRTASAAAGLK